MIKGDGMTGPLMPKATATWLVENTSLTFEQIAKFCELHLLEVQAIADAELSASMAPFDPIANEQLSWEEIERCSADPTAQLESLAPKPGIAVKKREGGRYTPVTKRQDKPNAIAWLLKHHGEMNDSQICRLLGTTSPTIRAIRERSHWNSANIRAKNPVDLGLCSQKELDEAVAYAKSHPKPS
ncbi:MAG: cell cycle transcriptional regulator TrcR [Pseudomonadota bacterium]